MLNEENLIFSTLEQSLRQFQQAEQRLQERLRKVEAEAMDLKVEIEALQNSAEKTEEALESLFSTMRSGTKSWKTHRKAAQEEEVEQPKKPRYDNENDYLKNQPRYDDGEYVNQRYDDGNSRYDDANYSNQRRYEDDERDYQSPSEARRYARPPVNNQPPPPDNYRNNSVAYLSRQRNVAPINRNYDTKSARFSDLTITQSCTLLLRETNHPLHVNELYNLLVEGGFNFTGNNPTISIAVSLNRNRRFRKVAPGTFALVIRDASQAAS